MSKTNVDFETFRKTRSQQFREWRQARAQRFSNWRKDVVGRFTQRGWIETRAEVTSCKPLRTHYYSNQAYASLGGWAVTFNYYVDGKTYDGIAVSPDELQEHDTFTIRYNPARPDENNSPDSEFGWFDGTVMWAYDIFLFVLVLGLVIAGIGLRH
jgi:hypothetical protein